MRNPLEHDKCMLHLEFQILICELSVRLTTPSGAGFENQEFLQRVTNRIDTMVWLLLRTTMFANHVTLVGSQLDRKNLTKRV